jgi:integrase
MGLAQQALAGFLTGQREDSGTAPLTVAAAIRAYEKTRENLPTAHTRTAIWRRLEAHLGRHMASELDNTLVQRDFIKPRLKDAHPGTVRKEACFLLAVLRLAHDNGHLDRVPKFQLPPVSPPRERWLTPTELDRLEAAAPDFRTRLFIAIARYTGARMAAIQELTWARVDLEQKVIDFGAGLGKKRRARGVPIAAQLLLLLKEAKLRAGGEKLVIGPVSVRRGFLAAAARAGLEGVYPHVLRHSLASNAAQRGVALHLVAQVLGNTVAVVEKTYAKYRPEALSAVVENEPKANESRAFSGA